MLELKNISKVYKQKGVSVTALNNINIKFILDFYFIIWYNAGS